MIHRHGQSRTILIEGCHRTGKDSLKAVLGAETNFYDQVFVRGLISNYILASIYDRPCSLATLDAQLKEFVKCNPVIVLLKAPLSELIARNGNKHETEKIARYAEKQEALMPLIYAMQPKLQVLCLSSHTDSPIALARSVVYYLNAGVKPV